MTEANPPRRRSLVASSAIWLANATRALGPPLLFGLRLWGAVCLALYVAFWLQLDNPFWAGITPALVSQPQLGASLRRGWFMVIGTIVGSVAIVALTACFPQDRAGFLVGLASWGAVCALATTVFRNALGFGAALAGITAAIIAGDNLGATGGPNDQVFMLAVARCSEVCIGIVSAGVILAGTDLGGAQRRLATVFAVLAAEITKRFADTLALAGPDFPDAQPVRVELVRRVFALDPVLEEAFGESSQLRAHKSVLLASVAGLFEAVAGWRVVAVCLAQFPDDQGRQEADAVLQTLPGELRSAPVQGGPTNWISDPVGLRRISEEAVQRLIALPAQTTSLRLLADQTSKVLAGIIRALDGLALLVRAMFTAVAAYFSLFVAPTNLMSYDTLQFYNGALARFAGLVGAALSFLLLPPLAPALRTRRLLALTLRDLRRLATSVIRRRRDDWESRIYSRFSALPDTVEPLQRAQLLAALSVGGAIIQLCSFADRLNINTELDEPLRAIAGGNSAVVIARLGALDDALAARPDSVALGARACILAISQVLTLHAAYFEAGAE